MRGIFAAPALCILHLVYYHYLLCVLLVSGLATNNSSPSHSIKLSPLRTIFSSHYERGSLPPASLRQPVLSSRGLAGRGVGSNRSVAHQAPLLNLIGSIGRLFGGGGESTTAPPTTTQATPALLTTTNMSVARRFVYPEVNEIDFAQGVLGGEISAQGGSAQGGGGMGTGSAPDIIDPGEASRLRGGLTPASARLGSSAVGTAGAGRIVGAALPQPPLTFQQQAQLALGIRPPQASGSLQPSSTAGGGQRFVFAEVNELDFAQGVVGQSQEQFQSQLQPQFSPVIQANVIIPSSSGGGGNGYGPPASYSGINSYASNFASSGSSGYGSSYSLYCFSADSPVRLADGSGREKRMDELEVGDWVLSIRHRDGGGAELRVAPTQVRGWLHREPAVDAQFHRVQLESGRTLEATGRHLIYTTGEGRCALGSPLRLATADALRKGDCLYVTSDGCDDRSLRLERIVDVATIIKRGIYAPLTATGNLFVGDVLVSCYTRASEAAPAADGSVGSGVAGAILQQTVFNLAVGVTECWRRYLHVLLRLLFERSGDDHAVNDSRSVVAEGPGPPVGDLGASVLLHLSEFILP